ncbi:unnamed protein product [Owenia fusiformis]|uniref:Uncharacterized protein n=1 Tax=Owenia fusiformis TaxID=6347 RepID=A0A8J1XFG7_OWEFU|nr:unnamed protein product [Owenia fusiformis]
MEPYRVKSVEEIPFLTAEERKDAILKADFNPYKMMASTVTIDLLTDSGCSAMSTKQWSAMMLGDESYAGSASFERYQSAVQDITGYKYVLPTHQGRACEKVLFNALVTEGSVIVNNNHYDTTKTNIALNKGIALDIAMVTDDTVDFPGNMDIDKLKEVLAEKGEQIPLVMITATNNKMRGQPVSMANIKAASSVCKAHGVPFILDGCRFAENSWFIKERENGYGDMTPREIAKEMFSYADGCMISAKKDANSNIGGVLAMNSEDLYERCVPYVIATEGHTTYGGLSGRDLEAVAVGLYEVLDESYLRYRRANLKFFEEELIRQGVPGVFPAGGHAIFLNANKLCPKIPADEFPGLTFAGLLYMESGVRCCDLGRLAFGPDAPDLIRLAVPRRVYTTEHLKYVARMIAQVTEKNKDRKSGLIMTKSPPHLKHLTASFKMKEEL